jgi:phosphoglycerol transferase MdoB-like AlkP superfamily enzyme
VHALGFASVQQAADAYGLHANGREAIARALIAHGTPAAAAPHRNLVFLQMESWSAEPLRYQAPGFDMLGRLAQPLQQAYLFTSFDSAQDGTHPTLEAILFGTPITPLTQGPNGRRPIPWSVARVLKQAGYDTVFATSGQSGWRDLNRVLVAQGFDEVVDAVSLRKLYPNAQGGIWGVWDDYLFDYIRHRLATQPAGRPIFIYGMSTTNHPPYELPAGYQPPPLDMHLWHGETSADSLHDNLVSYRYVNDRFGQFMGELGADGTLSRTVVAATGDHNVRSFGVYATPERLPLKHRVPFAVWAGPGLCREQLALPASHRDMFPTLLPLLGITSGYLRTGRDLFDCSGQTAGAAESETSPRALSYTGDVRNLHGVWHLGQPRSFVCAATEPTPAHGCRFPASDDAAERAYWALMDWNVRAALKESPGRPQVSLTPSGGLTQSGRDGGTLKTASH